MIIKKPEYYDEFVCTADQCPFTCCREWKIEVDDQTNEKWKKLQAPEDVYPVRKNMSQYTQKKDNMRVIALNKRHICPFLNEQKLCRLVCTFGDDVLSKTCRVFPREIHKFLDQEEFFLMPSCPAVIDLMKKYPNCNYIETGAENIEKEKNPEFNELNFLRNVRSIFSDWMRRKEFDPQENLKHIFFAALELWRIWQENSNEDFLFSDDFNAQIKKNLKEYKTKKLQKELADAKASKDDSDAHVADLEAQSQELQNYKQNEAAFEEEKEKFYQEVVFSDKAPDISAYKEYYESIEPQKAEEIYKQVVEQTQENDEIKAYASTYSSMKPKQAAAIFNTMTDNLQLVGKILWAMDAQSRGNILGAMDADTAAAVTKLMEP